MTYPVSRDGEVIGTYDRDTVRSLLKAGILNETDYYWHEKSGEWQPLQRLLTEQNVLAAMGTQRWVLISAGVLAVLLFGWGAAAVLSGKKSSEPSKAVAQVPDGVAPPSPKPPIPLGGVDQFLNAGKTAALSNDSLEAARCFHEAGHVDPAKTEKWLRSTFDSLPRSDRGVFAGSVLELAKSCTRGRDIWCDPSSAERWFRLAAHLYGDERHLVSEELSKLVTGLAVSGDAKDEAAAEKWLKLAAELSPDRKSEWAKSACSLAFMKVSLGAAELKLAEKWMMLAMAWDPEVEMVVSTGTALAAAFAKADTVHRSDADAERWFKVIAQVKPAFEGAVAIEIGSLANDIALGRADSPDSSVAKGRSAPTATERDTKAQRWLRFGTQLCSDKRMLLKEALILASTFAVGDGVPPDDSRADAWFQFTAAMDAEGKEEAAICTYGLALCLRDGMQGLAKDAVRSLRWLRVSAQMGNSSAQYDLGDAHYLGEGLPKNLPEAVAWYRKAANQDHSDAQAAMGACYLYGEGVTKNTAEAVKWFQKSADQGNLDAKYHLAYCHLEGLGVQRNPAVAFSLLRESAERGHKIAQYHVGLCYFSGLGVAQDAILAHYWLSIAALQGNQDAKADLHKLEREMSGRQILAAKELLAKILASENTGDQAQTQTPSLEAALEARRGNGTGFFISSDGYLITNHHVVDEGSRFMVRTSQGVITPAALVAVDEENDLALLKIKTAPAWLPIASSDDVSLGTPVVTVGFPSIDRMGVSPKFTKGDISSLAGIQDETTRFQISVPVQPGNSGGSLVDDQGNVVGVVVSGLNSREMIEKGMVYQNVNYAVKSSVLLQFLDLVPNVNLNLAPLQATQIPFQSVVKAAEKAAVLVLVY